MKRINLKRSAALALAAVTILGGIVVPQATAQAAGKSTVYLVTESQSNGGGKTKYSYNSKGLLTKEVYTRSSKSKSSEDSYTSTSKYSYNKKDRVAKSEYSSVSTSVNYDLEYTDSNNGREFSDRKPAEAGKNPTTTTYKSNSSTSYTYDKKGNVTQKVTTSTSLSLPENSTSTNEGTTRTYIYSRYDENDNKIEGTGQYVDAAYKTVYEYTYSENPDGSRTYVSKRTSTSLDEEKSTATNLQYVTTVSTDTTVSKTQTVTTATYTYDKKKRVKKAVYDTVETTNSTETDVYNYTDGTSNTDETVRTTVKTSRSTDTYTYNKKGKATKVVTFSEPDVSNVTDASYTYTYQTTDSTGAVKTNTTKSSSNTTTANGTRTRTSTSYNSDGSTSSTTKAVPYPANTTTYTTTIKYDKKGNVKSTSGKTVETNNRVYTYTVNTDGDREIQYNMLTNSDGSQSKDYDSPVYTTRTYTSTSSNSKEVELKKNTARLTKAVGMYKSLGEGESDSSYSVSRTTYKVKAKKVAKSAASSANKQQWIMQNGSYNGVMGLQ